MRTGRPRIDDTERTSASAKWDAKRDRSKVIEPTTGGRPRMPESVKADPVASKKFKDTVRLMRNAETLDPKCVALLEVLALTYSQWMTALKSIREDGDPRTVTIPVKGGTAEVQKTNPNVRTAADCAKTIIQISDRLGLSPTQRDRVRKTKPTAREQAAAAGTVGAIFPDLLRPKLKVCAEPKESDV